MKVFINNRNLLTWPKAIAERVASEGHEPVFVDNASTYPPLVEWYAEKNFPVLQVGRNLGLSAPWYVIGEQTEPYVVTDPDLDLSGVPADWPQVLLKGLEECKVKCGLSLKDDDIPKASVLNHMDNPDLLGKNFWPDPVTLDGHTFFRYPVDTTFAVYEPQINVHRIGGMRAAVPYTARHLPWHIVPERDETDTGFQIPMDAEYAYYILSAEGESMARFEYMKMMARCR